MKFNKKLKELREEKGLSQEALAIDLNLSQSTISNYESGSTSPTIQVVEKFAEYFGVPTEAFLSEMTFYATQNSGGQNGCYINNNHTFTEEMIEPYKKIISLQEEKILFLEEKIKNLEDRLKNQK